MKKKLVSSRHHSPLYQTARSSKQTLRRSTTRCVDSTANTTLAETHERVIGGASRNMRTGVARGAATRRSRLGRLCCSSDGCATLGVVNAGGTSSARAGVASTTSASATGAQVARRGLRMASRRDCVGEEVTERFAELVIR